MWNEEQQQRFQALRTRERQQALNPMEQAELARMIQELEAEEAAYLRPATERIRQESLRLEEQNKALQVLVRRKERLARRLEHVLVLSASEREKINSEVTAILSSTGVGAG